MDIPTLLSESIKDEYRCISVKINYKPDEDTSEEPEEFYSIQSYLTDLKLEIIYSTMGLHLNGENKKPHLHYHLIVKELPSGTFQSNNSQHRKRWMAKDENQDFSFENTSIRFPKKENPVWQHLAYPLKEGHILKKGIRNLNKEKLEFLLEYGKNLYQVSLGNRARQDACEERKKVSLNTLAKLLGEHKSEFTDYRTMVLWLDINYIEKLPLEEYPDPKNYKTNCQKIAVNLGILKYSNII